MSFSAGKWDHLHCLHMGGERLLCLQIHLFASSDRSWQVKDTTPFADFVDLFCCGFLLGSFSILNCHSYEEEHICNVHQHQNMKMKGELREG